MSTLKSRLYNWVNDKGNNVKITASRQDGEFDQVIAALNQKVLCSASAPGSPISGQSWVDTSITPPLLKTYNGSTWDVVGHATGANLASATTPTFLLDGDSVTITGTTTITGFASMPAGTLRFVTFSGILQLTYNGTSFILPLGTSNITTAAGDSAVFLSLGSGNWKCVYYQRKDGTPLSGGNFASQAEMESASATDKTASPGRVQFHPGVAKGWCVLDGTGTVAILESYNVSGIVDDGTGLYTVQWDTDFSTSNYMIVATAYNTTTGSGFMCHVTAQAAGSCQIKVTENAAGATDVDKLYVMAMGDQA